MVFNLAANRDRLRRAKAALLGLTLLLAGSPANADGFTELFRNTVRIVVTKDGNAVARGVGLFLGSYEGKALLLTPAHVLYDPREIGRKGSSYTLEVSLLDSTLRFGYAESSLHLRASSLEQAIDLDYVIVALPLAQEKRAAIFNLTSKNFRRPDRNQNVIIYSLAPHGGHSIIEGQLVGRVGEGVVRFEVKADKAIDEGESGSLILGSGEVVVGILSSSDGRNLKGVYPALELAAALQSIARLQDVRPYSHGLSLTVAPTYQIASVVEELGDGVTRSSTHYGAYTSFEIELFKTSRSAGDLTYSKYGLVMGYSNGGAHALGHVNGVDYTLKYGAIIGSINRFDDDTGQFGVFVLSHNVNGSFVHRLGVSMEATTQFWVGDNTALDGGIRLEIDRLRLSGGGRNGAFGLGFMLRYTWLRGT